MKIKKPERHLGLHCSQLLRKAKCSIPCELKMQDEPFSWHSVSSFHKGLTVSNISYLHICVLVYLKYQDCEDYGDQYFQCKNKMGKWVTVGENELHISWKGLAVQNSRTYSVLLDRMSTISLSLWEAVGSSPVEWHQYYSMLLFHSAFGEITELSGLHQGRLALIKIAFGNNFAKQHLCGGI